MVGTSETLWTASKTIRCKKSPLSLLMLSALVSPIFLLLLFSLSSSGLSVWISRLPDYLSRVSVKYPRTSIQLYKIIRLFRLHVRSFCFSLATLYPSNYLDCRSSYLKCRFDCVGSLLGCLNGLPAYLKYLLLYLYSLLGSRQNLTGWADYLFGNSENLSGCLDNLSRHLDCLFGCGCLMGVE